MRKWRNRLSAMHALRGDGVVHGVDFGGSELASSKVRSPAGRVVYFIDAHSITWLVDDDTHFEVRWAVGPAQGGWA